MDDRKGNFLPILKRQHQHTVKSRGRLAVLNLVRNANLSLMFDGLIAQAKKMGIRVEDLDYGQCLMFVNRDRDYVKMLMGTRSSFPVISAYRFPPGQKFPFDGVREIAKAFKAPEDISAVDKLKRGVEHFYAKKRIHSTVQDRARKERDVTSTSH